MDKYPLLWERRSIGELMIEKQSQQTRFALRCRLPEDRLWCAWAVGDQSELRLGVLQNQGGNAVLDKQFSRRMTEPLGRVLHGEVRLAGAEQDTAIWQPMREAAAFRTPWLQRQLRSCREGLWSSTEKGRLVAVPYRADQPFPLMPMFCFAKLRWISGSPYLVIALNEKEQPYV